MRNFKFGGVTVLAVQLFNKIKWKEKKEEKKKNKNKKKKKKEEEKKKTKNIKKTCFAVFPVCYVEIYLFFVNLFFFWYVLDIDLT